MKEREGRKEGQTDRADWQERNKKSSLHINDMDCLIKYAKQSTKKSSQNCDFCSHKQDQHLKRNPTSIC